ncbi:MAG: LUD domain-containing protein [Bacteroidales bacterium]|nr:LUD domain-containing protein [Bacteroidales bacterium]
MDAVVNTFDEVLYSHYLSTSAGAVSYYKSRSAYETVKRRAAYYRYKVLHSERKYLIEFEKNFSLSGGKVFYAETAADTFTEIKKIFERIKFSDKKILFNKSDLTTEIGIEDFLEKEKLSVITADLPKLNDPFIPENYSTFKEKIMKDDSFSAYPEDIYKQYLRQHSYKNSVAIGAADFLIADTGAVVIRDNSGGSALSFLLGQTKIFIAGIDQMLASLSDLSLYSRLYATTAYNRPLSLNQTIFSGRSDTYLIVVDNGRTDILSDPERRSVLSCIKCGTCNGICPTGNPVEFVKSGCGDRCTLCGHCQDVCPVNIRLKDLILRGKKKRATAEVPDTSVVLDKNRIKTLVKMFLKRKNLENTVKRFFLKSTFKKAFGTSRIFPNFNKKSFNQIWMEKHPPVEEFVL